METVAPVEIAGEDRAAIAGLVAEHDRRVARLEVLESRAAVELRWKDADGEHFEPCDADIFLSRGGRGAVRLTKLGNNLLWVGGDGTQVWVFELGSSPTRATVYQGLGHGAAIDAGEAVGGGEFTLLSPRSLRSLAALAAVGDAWELVPIEAPARATASEPAGADAASVASDPVAPTLAAPPACERYAVRFPVEAGIVATMRFGRDGLPAEVRLDDRSGTALARARLSDPVAARADGLAVGAWPRLPTRIEVDAPRSGASLRLKLDEPVAMERRAKARFFDLAALLAQLRPEQVAYIAPPGVDGGVDADVDADVDAKQDERVPGKTPDGPRRQRGGVEP